MTETLTILGNLGEFVGALLIAGTLVYLAIQTSATSKNVELLKTQNISAVLGRFNEKLAESHEATELWYKGTRGHELDEIERIRFNSLWVLWQSFVRVLWASGERDPEQYMGWVRVLTFPGAREKFDSSTALPPELKVFLEQLFQERFNDNA